MIIWNILIGSGARNGARTRDNRNHNPGLYDSSLRSHPSSLREKGELTALLANMHDS